MKPIDISGTSALQGGEDIRKTLKITNPDGGRSIQEWYGRTPDSMPPPSIRARIFTRAKGKCCLTDREIRPQDTWELHHVIGLLEGGENRESNLAPALTDPHKEETIKQRKRKAKSDSIRIKHIGANDSSPYPIKSAGFTKIVRDKPRIKKDELPTLTRRSIYAHVFENDHSEASRHVECMINSTIHCKQKSEIPNGDEKEN